MDRTTEHALLSLLVAEQRRRGLSLLLVSHDLVRVSSMADRTYVLYAGEVVEEASREGLENARHPYTRALLASRPNPARLRGDPALSRRLAVLPGSPPRFERLPGGCRFAPRCSERFERCLDHPPLTSGVAGAIRCYAAITLNPEANSDETQPKEASA
jgi:oligopeptide/dipeptide ABC transporter ATP-binding protein